MEMKAQYPEKTTVKCGSELVTLWVPLDLLKAINAYVLQQGVSRSKLLLHGALHLMREHPAEGLIMPDAE